MSNFSGWSEAILFSLAFVTVLTIAIVGMNSQYSQTYSIGLTDNKTEQLFIDYQDTADKQLSGGEVSFDATNGVQVKSSYGLLLDLTKIIWSFLTGGWIENLVNTLNLGLAGVVLARVLRIIYMVSMILAILYALFKVRL